MTDRIEEIKARRAAATKGTWVHQSYDNDEEYDGKWFWLDRIARPDNEMNALVHVSNSDDAEFIAAAPGDIDYLLQLVEEKDAEIKEMRAEIIRYVASLSDGQGEGMA